MGIYKRLVESSSTQSYPFVFKVTTTSAGVTFTLPLVDFGALTPNISVTWGDGNSNTITSSTSGGRIHTYASAGTYTVSVYGNMPGFKVNNNVAIRSLITELVQWGVVGLRTFDFYGCNNLTAIPGSGTLSGVGGYTGLSEVTTFTSAFRGTGITSIPTDLFNYSPNAVNISATFQSIAITSIPSGLFNSVPLVTNFSSCFSNCTALTTVPSTLFDLCPNVVNFASTFQNCRLLTSPLQFTYNLSVSTFVSIYNMSTTTNSMSGTAPEIWNRIPAPAGTNAFNNCLGLSNYASIPANFK
jgi:hypothetical protein